MALHGPSFTHDSRSSLLDIFTLYPPVVVTWMNGPLSCPFPHSLAGRVLRGPSTLWRPRHVRIILGCPILAPGS